MRVFASRLRLAAGSVIVGLSMLAPSTASAAAETDGWPTKVSAKYEITFNGLSFGSFKFSSSLTDGQYTLSGDAKLSALFGAFKWRGITKSVGSAAKAGLNPKGYAFSFDGGDKKGRIDMAFASNAVSKVTVVPPPKAGKKLVPVTKDHLKSVLDPLSAIMAISITPGGKVDGVNPCKRPQLAIFDGKQRFNLKFSSKRKEQVSDGTIAFVCGIKYQPVSGHSPTNDETKYMTENTGIEIWMVPVKQARLFIPYRIIVPTWAGEATLTSEKVVIDTPDNGRIAFAN